MTLPLSAMRTAAFMSHIALAAIISVVSVTSVVAQRSSSTGESDSDGASGIATFFIVFGVVVVCGCALGIAAICFLMIREKPTPIDKLPFEERLVGELIGAAEGKCPQPALKKYYGPHAQPRGQH